MALKCCIYERMKRGIRMKKKIIDICDKTVYNYRIAKEELRYDGDYINHFAAII